MRRPTGVQPGAWQRLLSELLWAAPVAVLLALGTSALRWDAALAAVLGVATPILLC